MNQPIRRRRRRLGDSESSDLTISRTEPSDTSLKHTDTESQHDDPPDNTSQVNVDSNTPTTYQAAIDRIRSEILEEQYHHLLDEPHYSNDSHDWDDEEESCSSDYWHFLGRFE